MNQKIQNFNQIPEDETKRQFYFMDKAKVYVDELTKKLGRKPTCCVTTFGCQMNARDSEKLVGILERVGYEIIEGVTDDEHEQRPTFTVIYTGE